MFWVFIVGLFLGATAIIVLPLLRNRNDVPSQENQNQKIEVYKAQLQELGADQNNEMMSVSEASSAKLEIERRLLKASDGGMASEAVSARNAPRSLLIALSVIILMFSVGFYLMIGKPGMPDFILKNQAHAAARTAAEKAQSKKALTEITDIKSHLKDHPKDAKAWRALGQYSAEIQNTAAAAQAFQHWYELEPENIAAAVIYAESLIILSEGRVSPASLLILHRAQKRRPDNPGVRYYLALAKYQAGEVAQALTDWKKLAADSGPKAPWLRILHHWITQAQTDLGLPAEHDRASQPPLSQEARQSMNNMSPQEQMDMIKSMVARLAQKMVDNPKNIDGWFRLSQAYSVLGQKQAAITALRQAEKYAEAGDKAQVKKRLDILLKEE